MLRTAHRLGILAPLLAIALLASGTDAAPDDDLKEKIAQFRRAYKEGGERTRIKLVNDLATIRDKAAGTEIRKVVRGDRSERVQAAAAVALGTRGDPKDLAWLSGATRSLRKKPIALAGVIDGIGEYRQPKMVKLLEDTACKWFAKHKYPVLASIRALSKIRSSKSVEALINLLGRTHVSRGMQGPHGAGRDGSVQGGPGGSGMVSDDTQARVADFRPYILKGLQRLTGEVNSDLDLWQEWWEDNERTFDASKVRDDPNGNLTFTDDVHRFTISRPTSSWKWIEKADRGYSHTAVFEYEGEEGGRLSVLAYSTWVHGPIVASELAAKLRKTLEEEVSLVTEKRWDQAVEIDGAAAIRHKVKGARDTNVVTVEQTIFLHRAVMYVIETTVREGVFGQDREDFEKFRDSFKFLK